MSRETAVVNKAQKSELQQQPQSKGELVAAGSMSLRLPYPKSLEEYAGIDKRMWQVLIDAVWPAAQSVESVCLAIQYCKSRNLDPLKRPVHIVPVWSKTGGVDGKGGFVETVWPGISEIRTTASRTGVYAGKDASVFGPEITKTFKKVDNRNGEVKEELEVTFPEWCQITVYRMVQGQRCAFVGPKVVWLEAYATKDNYSEIPNSMWADRRSGQLEKCFSPDTEILTDRGFEPFPRAIGRILQVSEVGLEPTDAKPFVQKYSGPMIVANGDALNFSVTPNHDMVIEEGKIEASKMLSEATSVAKFRIPISVTNNRNDAPISDRTIHLAAAFACDGWRRPYGTFCISVSRKYKIEMLERVGGFKTRYTANTKGDTAVFAGREITTTADKEVFGYNEEQISPLIDLEKFFDSSAIISLSQRQARLLVDTMVAYDGADNGRGTMRFYSSNPAIMSAFELASVVAGYAVSSRRERITDGCQPNMYVTISDKVSLPVLRYSQSQVDRGDKGGIDTVAVNPSGDVWCVRVPSGVIVVRRNGLSMICGNCAEAAALRAAFPEELGNEYAAEEMYGRTIDVAPVVPQTNNREVVPPRPKKSEFERADRKDDPPKQQTPKQAEAKKPDPKPEPEAQLIPEPKPDDTPRQDVEDADFEESIDAPDEPKNEPSDTAAELAAWLEQMREEAKQQTRIRDLSDLREHVAEQLDGEDKKEWEEFCRRLQREIMDNAAKGRKS